jgi:predicted flavoprotein YhiN
MRLPPVAIGLLREAAGKTLPAEPAMLGSLIKAVPLRVTGIGSVKHAISSAGGVALDDIDADMMVKARPGIFVAGEMLDWEAPTGGYLLQACFATGHAAGRGVLRYLGRDLPIPASPGSSENCS